MLRSVLNAIRSSATDSYNWIPRNRTQEIVKELGYVLIYKDSTEVYHSNILDKKTAQTLALEEKISYAKVGSSKEEPLILLEVFPYIPK